MKGVKLQELEEILDFMYYGWTNIVQEDLQSFLVLAEELKIEGLEGWGDRT